MSNHATHSYTAALADEIEKQIEEAAEMGEPPSFALRRDQADWLVRFLKNAATQVPEVREAPGNPIASSPAVAAQTPRTDAFANERLGGSAQTARYRTDSEWRAFARQLERDLRQCAAAHMLRAVDVRPTGPSGEGMKLFKALADAAFRSQDAWDQPGVQQELAVARTRADAWLIRHSATTSPIEKEKP